MVNIPMIAGKPVNSQSVLSINQIRVQGAKSSRDITSINNGTRADGPSASHRPSPESRPSASPNASAPQKNRQESRQHPQTAQAQVQTKAEPSLAAKPVPPLLHTVQKGQKAPLETQGKLAKLHACLGWNTSNAACDVDVSAFLLNGSGKVPGDTWFVFYGQTQSPDASTRFLLSQGTDREIISIDFSRLSPQVKKIVFVLTINEALERHLHFGMLKDAYIRLLEPVSGREIVSFRMTEYYSNVTSMMIGEIYQHNGQWKFNAVGNGVARDLAGLCELYGVQVI